MAKTLGIQPSLLRVRLKLSPHTGFKRQGRATRGAQNLAQRGGLLKLHAIIRAVELKLGGCLHSSARANADMHVLHLRILSLRLASGMMVLATLPLMLAYYGGLNAEGGMLVAGFAATLLSALILSLTGSLVASQLMASAGFCLSIFALCLMTGGSASPLLMMLVFVPFETQVSRRRLAALGAGVLCATVLCILLLTGWGQNPYVVINEIVPSLESRLTSGVVAVAIAFSTFTTIMVMGQRSQISQERRQMLARSRLMLESVGDIVAWFDQNGRLSYVNEAARNILNTAPSKLLGRGLFEHVHVADRPMFLKAIDDVAHGGEPHVVNFRVMPCQSGDSDFGVPSMRWIEMRVQRAAVSENTFHDAAVVAVMRDETDRRQIEQDRENARVEAQRASELKGRFLATVSHELRTPLNAIIGFSEMLATEGLVKPGSEQQRDYAQIIQTSGTHLLEVVNALLDISKIESGAMTIERDTLDLPRLMGECCDLMTMRCAEKGVELERVVAGDLPQVMADRRALKQVVINLLSNALKFTPEGGRITVALVRDKGEIDISISDTGIGIAAADLPQLGLPFFQAKSAYDRSHEGTGLGLSVVRGLVGLHGGAMSIESAPGEGTRVCVRLPINPDETATGDTARIVTFAKPPRRKLGFDTPSRISA
jgi:two-component system, cell cycle sensor histidine kinase DivJ